MASDQNEQKTLDVIDFHCGHCRIKLASEHELKEHLMTVHVDKTKCNTCGKVFLHNNLLRHVKEVHEKASTAKCPQCNKTYSSASNLKIHIKYVHDKVELKYKCDLCDVKQSSPSHLKIHKEVVHGKKQMSIFVKNVTRILLTKVI